MLTDHLLGQLVHVMYLDIVQGSLLFHFLLHLEYRNSLCTPEIFRACILLM